jgi:hypothetical protein
MKSAVFCLIFCALQSFNIASQLVFDDTGVAHVTHASLPLLNKYIANIQALDDAQAIISITLHQSVLLEAKMSSRPALVQAFCTLAKRFLQEKLLMRAESFTVFGQPQTLFI